MRCPPRNPEVAAARDPWSPTPAAPGLRVFLPFTRRRHLGAPARGRWTWCPLTPSFSTPFRAISTSQRASSEASRVPPPLRSVHGRPQACVGRSRRDAAADGRDVPSPERRAGARTAAPPLLSPHRAQPARQAARAGRSRSEGPRRPPRPGLPCPAPGGEPAAG